MMLQLLYQTELIKNVKKSSSKTQVKEVHEINGVRNVGAAHSSPESLLSARWAFSEEKEARNCTRESCYYEEGKTFNMGC